MSHSHAKANVFQFNVAKWDFSIALYIRHGIYGGYTINFHCLLCVVATKFTGPFGNRKLTHKRYIMFMSNGSNDSINYY